MISWDNFSYFALPSVILWIVGASLLYKYKKSIIPHIVFLIGVLLYTSFISGYWLCLGYPPFRTMGETRLWYSLFIIIIGYTIYYKWRYKWLLLYSTLVSSAFIGINIFKPELHSAYLMPALQSAWFIPHVSAYIISYAMFGAASVAALQILFSGTIEKQFILKRIDNLVYIGFAFLMCGLMMGAMWAKQVWGDYWTWDPKETWAFATASSYLAYMHIRKVRKELSTLALYILIFSFILLLITWLGVSYLPTSSESIHVY